MSKNQEYAQQHAEYAMEQMRRYGIPASVTLAQGILESSNGQSRLAQRENNHFGIKATPAWIADGGKYGLYSDDKPNEKFCSYDGVGDSYEHHSRFLKENSRYDRCFMLSPDDYKGWTQGIAQAGYATGGKYAENLQRIIEQNGLQQYDKQVMQEMAAQGRSFGVENNPLRTSESATNATDYSFPVEREEFLFITSGFGMRQDPTDKTKQQMHKGLDIRCNGDAVLATENGGKVVAVNQNRNTPGGKSLTVEYTREDGSKVQCTYMHLGEVSVKVGDTVQAGGRLGKSGNTGTRTTGEHLHFGVTNIHPDGTRRDIDPAAYLAEIAQKGTIKQQVLLDGNDLLAKYRSTEEIKTEKPLSPDDWMKKLLSSEDSGVGMSGCNDPVVEMAMTAFTSLMLLATQIDNRNEEQQKASISEAMDNRHIDLKSLLPGMKSCDLTIGENGKALLRADNGSIQVSRELTAAELSRLSATLNNNALPEEAKRLRVSGLLNTVILSEAASQNFEQGMSAQQEQTENLKR
ncbi:glucosaminidase domain-containing protein [Bacteroides hominis]|uniref:glucosaminidase domain-containing protein n=1 Tax=Bacteroides hominis TaxID=2763023 RepID=UPI00164C356C|nr:glucosaminidase domain-containing protein [Bacteroides hominis (ex Liu et al. 2022)]MBC5614600.1 glucosaminidase domain-containing protein [Bacteroides hominis (ex Liu et al. 2022)]